MQTTTFEQVISRSNGKNWRNAKALLFNQDTDISEFKEQIEEDFKQVNNLEQIILNFQQGDDPLLKILINPQLNITKTVKNILYKQASCSDGSLFQFFFSSFINLEKLQLSGLGNCSWLKNLKQSHYLKELKIDSLELLKVEVTKMGKYLASIPNLETLHIDQLSGQKKVLQNFLISLSASKSIETLILGINIEKPFNEEEEKQDENSSLLPQSYSPLTQMKRLNNLSLFISFRYQITFDVQLLDFILNKIKVQTRIIFAKINVDYAKSFLKSIAKSGLSSLYLKITYIDAYYSGEFFKYNYGSAYDNLASSQSLTKLLIKISYNYFHKKENQIVKLKLMKKSLRLVDLKVFSL